MRGFGPASIKESSRWRSASSLRRNHFKDPPSGVSNRLSRASVRARRVGRRGVARIRTRLSRQPGWPSATAPLRNAADDTGPGVGPGRGCHGGGALPRAGLLSRAASGGFACSARAGPGIRANRAGRDSRGSPAAARGASKRGRAGLIRSVRWARVQSWRDSANPELSSRRDSSPGHSRDSPGTLGT